MSNLRHELDHFLLNTLQFLDFFDDNALTFLRRFIAAVQLFNAMFEHLALQPHRIAVTVNL